MQHKMLQNVYCKATNNFVTINATMPDSGKSSEELQKAFGAWLKAQRKLTGLSQKKVADEVPMDRVQLARIESGESGTKRDTVIGIVNAINKKSEFHKVDLDEALERYYGRWSEKMERLNNAADDELVAEGLFSGYYDLSPERQRLARKQIAALIRSLKEEDFED